MPREKRLVPSGIRPFPWVARIAVHRFVLRTEARLARATFGRVERDDVIANLHVGHARPDLDDDARPFVPEDRGEQALGVGAGERELVGVTDPGGLDLDENLARLRPFQLDVFDDQRLACFVCDSGPGFHGRKVTPPGSAGQGSARW